jgi:hypothetical protein
MKTDSSASLRNDKSEFVAIQGLVDRFCYGMATQGMAKATE